LIVEPCRDISSYLIDRIFSQKTYYERVFLRT